jgi:cysteine desulfurase
MDNNATTPVDPRVHAAMEPYLGERFGNAASSSHAYGWQAQSAVRQAREQVAALIGCSPKNVIWTSGATESNNLAILGLVRAFNNEKPHIITQATEHKAVLEVCEAATNWGADLTVLPVDGDGRVSLADIEKAITPRTVLCTIMMANNEIGTLQPVDEIARLCAGRKIIFHTDAAQSTGKYPFSLKETPIDLLSISGHKIYGPKGVGALILRPVNRDFELKPILFGGDQELSLRPGTLNVAGIVGLGTACALAMSEMKDECERLRRMRGQIVEAVLGRYPQARLNGTLENRLCNNISLSFPDVTPDDLVLELSGIAFSSGSACTSGNPKPSHVLKAIGLDDALAKATVRLGLGRFTTPAEVQAVTDKLLKMLEKTYASGSRQAGRPL